MESLALLVSIIVSPALFAGPIALLLSLFRTRSMSRFRSRFIIVLGLLSSVVGIFLILGDISRGASIIGVLGLVSGASSIWQLKRVGKLTP